MNTLRHLTPFLRSPSRVVVVLFMVACSLVGGRTADAWSGNGQPSELTTRTDINGSCSMSYSGVGGVQTNVTRTVWGVCHGRPSPSGGDVVRWLADGRPSADLFAFTWGGGAILNGASVSATPGDPNANLLSFVSAACPGVANCATFRIELSFGSGSATWRTVPTDTQLPWFSLSPNTGKSTAYCSGSCNYDAVANGQSVVYSVSPSADPVAPRWYWTQAWTPAPVADCASASLGLDVNGTPVVPGTVAVAGYTVSGADDVRVNLSYSSAGGPMVLRYRASPAAPFRDASVVSTATILTIRTDVIKLAITSAQPLSTFEFKCTGADGLSTYMSASGGTWSTAPALNRACASLVISLPDGTFSEGDTVKVGYSLPAPALGGFVNNDTFANVYISIPSTKDFPPVRTTRDSFGAIIGGPAPFLGDVPTGSRGTIEFANVRANTGQEPFLDRPLDVLKINCTDSLGKFQVEGTGPAVSFILDLAKSASCYDGAGMSLQPSTWIRGFAKMGSCLAQQLVVPDTGSMAKAVVSLRSTLENRPPFSLAITAVSFVTDVNASLNNPRGTGCFGMPGVPLAGGRSSCIGDGMTVAAGQRSTMALLILGPFYVAILMHAVGLVRER